MLYKYNNSSYDYEGRFLQYKVNQTKDYLNHYLFINSIKDIQLNSPDSILSLNLKIVGNKKLILLPKYFLKISGDLVYPPRHPGDAGILEIYAKDGSLITNIGVKYEKSIKEVINNFIYEYNDRINETKQPQKYLIVTDFWLESITGFIFGDIKPVSTFSKLVRVLQLIVSVLFSLLLANSFSSLNKFSLKRN